MNISDILTRFRTDPEFAAKYTNLKNIDAIQAQLKSDGYDVSVDDIRAGIGQLRGSSGELSEADLTGIAGGASVGTPKKCPGCGSDNWDYDWDEDGGTWQCLECGYTERGQRG